MIPGIITYAIANEVETEDVFTTVVKTVYET